MSWMMPKAIFQVMVDGVDYTSSFDPVLEQIRVSDQDGTKSDTANIVVADPDGRTYLPQPDATISVYLGHAGSAAGIVFIGKVDQVRSRGSKNGGRQIAISGKGLDTKSKAKQPTDRSADNKTFQEVAQQWASASGLSGVQVAPGLRSIRRDYWSMQNESFVHWGERTADEIGGVFRISNNMAVFLERGAGQDANGKPLPTVMAEWGRNLISWDIDPYTGRGQWNQVRARWYDRTRGQMQEERESVGDTTAQAEGRRPHVAASQGAARQNARSDRKKSKKNKGGGTIVILGDPSAKPEGMVVISGARPGVDGEYRIRKIDHSMSKSQGFITTISLAEPKGKAGKDSRRSSRRRR